MKAAIASCESQQVLFTVEPPIAQPAKVVHCKREAYDVYIGRPARGLKGSIWANPFHIGKDGTREEVIAKYRTYILDNPDLLGQLESLRGKVLGCWCKPERCHGDVLVELLNDGIPSTNKPNYGPCCKTGCQEDAVLKSPGGSVYCAECGKCGHWYIDRQTRCGTSVEKFILHPRLNIWVCPCMLKFDQGVMR